MRNILLAALILVCRLSLMGDAMSEWNARIADKNPSRSVTIGDECLSWYGGEASASNELGEDINFSTGYYLFKCGAVLRKTAAGYRLDIDVPLVTSGISSHGDIAIYLTGSAIIGSDGVRADDGNLLLFGGGQLSVSGNGESGIYGKEGLSICGPSVTVSGFDTAIDSPFGDLLVSGATVACSGFSSGAMYTGYQMNILGAVVTMASSQTDASGVNAHIVVVDGSMVSAVTHGPCLEAYVGLSFTHSYVNAARTKYLAADDTYDNLAAIGTYGYPMDLVPYVSFDSCCVRIWSNRQCVNSTTVSFGDGSYRLGSRQGGGESAILDVCYATDSRCAVSARDQCVIDGADMKICCPGGIGIRGYGNEDNVIVKSGRFESTGSLNVKTDLAFDAATVALYVTGTGSGFLSAANNTMANFFSTALVGAYNSGRLLDLSGSAYCAISGGWHNMSYRQTGGTVIVDGAKYGLYADKAVITGGSFHGSMRSIDEDRETVPVVNGSDAALVCIPYVAKSMDSDRKVSQSWTGILPSYYGTEDLYADRANKLYFWLPEGTTIGGGSDSGDTDSGGADPGTGSETGGGDSGSGDDSESKVNFKLPDGYVGLSKSENSGLSTQFYVGDSVYLNMIVGVIKNGERAPSDTPVKIRAMLDTGKKYDYTLSVAEFSPVIGSDDLSTTVLLESSVNLTPGDYVLTVKLDPDNEIEEPDEDDNSQTIRFSVVASEEKESDEDADGDPEPPSTESKFNFSLADGEVWLANATNGMSITVFTSGESMYLATKIGVTKDDQMAPCDTPVKIRVTLNTGMQYDHVFTVGDLLRYKDQSGLHVAFLLEQSLNLAPGEYTLTAVLDPDNEIDESNEGDNGQTVSFTVVAPEDDTEEDSKKKDEDGGWNFQVYDFGMYTENSQGETVPCEVFSEGDPIKFYADIRSYKDGVMTNLPGLMRMTVTQSPGDTKTYDFENGIANGKECWYTRLKSLAVGEYTLSLSMDASSVVSEADLSDNARTVAFKVVASESSSGDDEDDANDSENDVAYEMKLSTCKGKNGTEKSQFAKGSEVWACVNFQKTSSLPFLHTNCTFVLRSNGDELLSFDANVATYYRNYVRIDDKVALSEGEYELTGTVVLSDKSSGSAVQKCTFSIGAFPEVSPNGYFNPSAAHQYTGVLLTNGVPTGVISIKTKAMDKKYNVKVSGTLTDLAGKRHAVKGSANCFSVIQYGSGIAVNIKDYGDFTIKFGKDSSFRGALGSSAMASSELVVQSASVGGSWTASESSVTVEMDDVSMIPGTVQTQLLPNGEPVVAKNGKWSFRKASTVKWTKDRTTKEYGLVVDQGKDGSKANLSGLKLTYTPKTGVFKGSYKIYSLVEQRGRTVLKKYTVNVNGFVIEGVGYGTAVLKSPAAKWSVMVK